MKEYIAFLDRRMLIPALIDSIKKLSPISQAKNPVMFVVYACSILTTVLFFYSLSGHNAGGTTGFILNITLWLWFTLIFANFAESLAEGRSKAQADSLKSLKKDVL
ncbi:MAG TPA: potassium-transporting ATPase subunit B, partial [Aquella sp.]|nr:potassium-transporting ATPase subunit B [Aquella sp.]